MSNADISKPAKTPLPIAKRLTCSVAEARELSGLCHQSIYNAINDGRLATKRFGKRRLIIVPSLLRLLGAEEASAA